MKKITLCFACILLLILSMLTLTSCSNNDVEFLYHIDSYSFEIVVPVEQVIENYQEEVLNQGYLNSYEEEGKAHILVNLTYYDPADPSIFINNVRSSLSKLFPSYKDIINTISFEVKRDFFGTSLSGTEYYQFNINVPGLSNNIPIRFVSQSPFMVSGASSTWNESESRYNLTQPIVSGEDITTYELEYRTVSVSNGQINIDVSSPSPGIKYTFYHQADDLQMLEYELQALGMTVEFIDYQQVVFYESYDTTNDFNNMFPIRTYSIFGIVTTVNYKHGSFFTADGSFEITFHEVPEDLNISVTITAQDNSKFEITNNGNSQSETNNVISFELSDNTTITANYSNVRWFESITSMLVVIAIMFAIIGMIWLAKRK